MNGPMHRLPEEGNATEAADPRERRVRGSFEARAAEAPDAGAPVLGGAEVTRAGLSARANRPALLAVRDVGAVGFTARVSARLLRAASAGVAPGERRGPAVHPSRSQCRHA